MEEFEIKLKEIEKDSDSRLTLAMNKSVFKAVIKIGVSEKMERYILSQIVLIDRTLENHYK